MQCISTVEYHVRFNSKETETFKQTRGLRQGDQLSPYLFMLHTEGLTALLNKAEEEGKLEGVEVRREARAITNLLFADDSLITMKANIENAKCLKEIFASYCAASGQKISVDKSSVFLALILELR